MTDTIITGDGDETAAAEIQAHAEARGWGGVSPTIQQRVRFRATGHDAVVQRRGAFWFAWSAKSGAAVGPVSSRARAAREVETLEAEAGQ